MRRCASCLFAFLVAALTMAQTVAKLSVSPTAVIGGANATGTVTLSEKAGSSGAVVKLWWFYSGATVPGSVTVPSGSTSATFTVSTAPVAVITSAGIEARLGKSTKIASLTLEPPTLTMLTLGSTSATGASVVTGTVTLGSAAPGDGIRVRLSSNSNSACVPSTVTVAGGETSASFLISTRAVDASTTAKITAKFGEKSELQSLTLEPQPALAGVYSGSFFRGKSGSSDVALGPVSLTISKTGAMSGTLTGYGPKSDAAESKLSGTAKSDGEVSITVTGTGTSVTNVGVWGFNSAGDLVMKVENSRDSSDYTCVTLSTNGQLTPFAGNYTGSLVNEYGYGPYISSFSISAGGSITGTAVPLSDLTTGSYSGSFNSSGVGTVTFTSTVPGLTGYSSNAYAAFTPAGELVAYLTGGYWITLAKSYAGVHKITFRTGATAEFAVSDNGTVSGAWFIGVTPCLLTGTVSSAGALSVTATSVDSNTFATLQITGALWANLGGISGSGTYDGPELTWTSAGQDCSGLIYAGAYTLRSRAYTLAFTVDESGLISGTGDGGAVVTGGVLADGTILIIATPPSLSNAAAATSFSGTLSLKTVTSVKGQGTYMSLDGSSDSWTVTGTRV